VELTLKTADGRIQNALTGMVTHPDPGDASVRANVRCPFNDLVTGCGLSGFDLSSYAGWEGAFSMFASLADAGGDGGLEAGGDASPRLLSGELDISGIGVPDCAPAGPGSSDAGVTCSSEVSSRVAMGTLQVP
jgi:hypothetical protein